MAAFGSRGDLVPVLWAGQQMAANGHEVTVMASPVYQADVEKMGFKFLPIGTREEFMAQHSDPGLWDGTKTDAMTNAYISKSLRHFAAQMEPLKGKYDVLMHNPLALGAATMAEKHGVPCITLHPHPFSFWFSTGGLLDRNVMPVQKDLAPRLLRKLPGFILKPLLAMVGPLVTLPFKKLLNEFRAEQGMKPIKSFYKEAWLGHRAHAGLFPAFFGKKQPDWPKNFEQFQFPMLQTEEEGMDPMLAMFLDPEKRREGKTVVWTAGTANFAAQDFVNRAKAISDALGARAIIIDPSVEHQYGNSQYIVIKHVPLRYVLERSDAIVHHGGVGTAANAVAAGVPQLILPGMGDQFDNAERMKNLGVADSLPPKQRSTAEIRKGLSGILGNKNIKQAARTFSTLLRETAKKSPRFAEWAEKQVDAHHSMN